MSGGARLADRRRSRRGRGDSAIGPTAHRRRDDARGQSPVHWTRRDRPDRRSAPRTPARSAISQRREGFLDLAAPDLPARARGPRRDRTAPASAAPTPTSGARSTARASASGFDAREHRVRAGPVPGRRMTGCCSWTGTPCGPRSASSTTCRRVAPGSLLIERRLVRRDRPPAARTRSAGLKLAANLTDELLILNTATTGGRPDGALDGAPAEGLPGAPPTATGMVALNWFPAGPDVLTRILNWLGFPEARLLECGARRPRSERAETSTASRCWPRVELRLPRRLRPRARGRGSRRAPGRDHCRAPFDRSPRWRRTEAPGVRGRRDDRRGASDRAGRRRAGDRRSSGASCAADSERRVDPGARAPRAPEWPRLRPPSRPRSGFAHSDHVAPLAGRCERARRLAAVGYPSASRNPSRQLAKRRGVQPSLPALAFSFDARRSSVASITAELRSTNPRAMHAGTHCGASSHRQLRRRRAAIPSPELGSSSTML